MNNSNPPPAHNVQNDIRLLSQMVSDLSGNVIEEFKTINRRLLALEERLDILEEEKMNDN